MKQKKIILPEHEIPTEWYNIQAEMPTKPLPMLDPKSLRPITAEDLYPVFVEESAMQELNQTDAWIAIPEEVREKYRMYRSTPLVRAYELERALDTPAHIYFKDEGGSPCGSHKLNSALAQAYYAREQGITNVTTETGAGQWGSALSLASRIFGLECAVYQVRVSYEQKPSRRTMMQVYGAQLTPSPSMSTRAGKDVLTRDPDNPGSLGMAISEAIELARTTPNTKYLLGSVMNHVGLHQTVIGLEAERQMELAGEQPDVVIACFGGGSNFSGMIFPFLRHTLRDGATTRYVAVEPSSCPKLTRGRFAYDYGDEAGYTPLIPMYTLGHSFVPSAIHAGGLRYHGGGSVFSQLLRDGYIEAMDVDQLESFRAGMLFARTEGIIPAPESCHAIAGAIREAERCKREGKSETILFCLSGHGQLEISAYEQYIRHTLTGGSPTDEELRVGLRDLPEVPPEAIH